MNLHEYQAKDVFRSFGIPVPAGRVAGSPEEAVAAAQSLGGPIWVVKAQVHAGGRGKAGGRQSGGATWMPCGPRRPACWGRRLVTPQTGPEGLPVDKVYVESGSQIARELYLSLTLNRDKGRIALIASVAGGMDIEEVAVHTPEKIVSISVHPATGLAALSVPQTRLCLRLRGPADRPPSRSLRFALFPALRGAGREPGGDQSADRHPKR